MDILHACKKDITHSKNLVKIKHVIKGALKIF